MACLQLAHEVGYGLVAGRPVFLDLRRDRYFALPPEREKDFQRIVETGGKADRKVLDGLLSTGLFRETEAPAPLAPAVASAPCASILDCRVAASRGWLATVRAWRLLSRTRRRLGQIPLADLVAHQRHACQTGHCGDEAVAEDRARAFMAVRGTVPVPRSCLLDALALLEWLGPERGSVALVFAVRLDPFGAHCWLQTENMLLTDATDAISQFVPVLVA